MKEILSIFGHFFYLGCISFGGPAAHLGYFQRYFIEKHQWLDLPTYSRMVALSQFLPGPASSQVGFSLGYHRGGLMGAIAAFLGFTLPSFILLYLLAVLGVHFADSAMFVGTVYGLKLLAVVIVADAVISMSKVFCQTKLTKLIAAVSSVVILSVGSLYSQILLLVLAGLLSLWLLAPKRNNQQALSAKAETALKPEANLEETSKESAKENTEENPTAQPEQTLMQALKIMPLLLFCVCLFILPFFSQYDPLLALFNSFYQAGAFVFGGGHVVLPLLQQTLDPALPPDTFILGYASAQAVPGPMFTIATFLGANILLESPLLGASIATAAIFLPGFLLVLAVQQLWHRFAFQPAVAGFVTGVNAAVVGLLAAAFYQPIAINAIYSIADVAWVIAGFILLKFYRLPILAIVACFIAIGILMTLS
ncbi:MAG: chromate efflux transporter [Thalassotalea sp.]